jgi:hypothetical protein
VIAEGDLVQAARATGKGLGVFVFGFHKKHQLNGFQCLWQVRQAESRAATLIMGGDFALPQFITLLNDLQIP